MASRTYMPGLIILGKAVRKYVTKNREKINANLPTGGVAILDALMEALDALLEIIVLPPLGD